MGDVWVNRPPAELGRRIAVLSWKRLIKKEGARRRVTDGEPQVYVLDKDTFWTLLEHYLHDPTNEDVQVVLQCKAREALSVTRALHDAKQAAGHTGLHFDGLGTN